MSCNGCRVLRKGCSDSCILRSSLLWIDSPEAQGHATVFVAKFFGRAGMISFINAVPESQRPALFQSLLYEACGRTVNPVFGAVGLLWSGNWAVCQAAVETVLKGGAPKPSSALGNPAIINPYANAPASMKFGVVEKQQPSSSPSPHLLHPNPNPNPNPSPSPSPSPNLNPSPSLDPNSDADSMDPPPNPPPKRPRSCPPLPDAQCSALPEPKLENQAANRHHASSPSANESEQASAKEASASPSLIAPVARRVLRPLVLPGHSLPCGASNPAFLASDRPPSSSSSSGNRYHDPSADNRIEPAVELDLTLSSSLAKSSSASSHGSPPTCCNRASSPCSLSEGSDTTSLDTAELSVSCFRAAAALSPQGPLGEEPQLLKLL